MKNPIYYVLIVLAVALGLTMACKKESITPSSEQASISSSRMGKPNPYINFLKQVNFDTNTDGAYGKLLFEGDYVNDTVVYFTTRHINTNGNPSSKGAYMGFYHNRMIKGVVYPQAIGQLDVCGGCQLDAKELTTVYFTFYTGPLPTDTVAIDVKIKKY